MIHAMKRKVVLIFVWVTRTARTGSGSARSCLVQWSTSHFPKHGNSRYTLGLNGIPTKALEAQPHGMNGSLTSELEQSLELISAHCPGPHPYEDHDKRGKGNDEYAHVFGIFSIDVGYHLAHGGHKEYANEGSHGIQYAGSQLSQIEMRSRFGTVVNKKVKLKVSACLFGESNIALSVVLPSTVDGEAPVPLPASQNKYPHITVWFGEGSVAADSNKLPDMVAAGTAKALQPSNEIEMDGTLTFWLIDNPSPTPISTGS